MVLKTNSQVELLGESDGCPIIKPLTEHAKLIIRLMGWKSQWVIPSAGGKKVRGYYPQTSG